MLKRIIKLFQIARKLSTSGAVDTINELHKLPTTLNLFFNIFIRSNTKYLDKRWLPPGEKLVLR